MLLDHVLSGQPVLGHKLLGKVHGVVDECETGQLATAEVGLEAVGEDTIRGALVHLGDLFADLSLRDRRPVGVEDIDDHLPAAEKPVAHVLAGTNRHRAFGLKTKESLLAWLQLISP